MDEVQDFSIGDKIRVYMKIREGNKERTQRFEGIVIKKSGSGIGKTFTVRRVSYGIGIERIFPLHSPNIQKIHVAKRGKVRRAKLYYLRGRKGKSAMRVKEA
jgi:large subunit ribosomal protein L19